MVPNIPFGRRGFLKLAAAGVIGMAGNAGATASASDGESYTLTVHAFDGGRWDYSAVTGSDNIQKGATADENDEVNVSISGDAVSGTIFEGYYDDFVNIAVDRLTVSTETDDTLTIHRNLDTAPSDLYVRTSSGEWTYYISARDTITKASASEDTETDYGASVSGTISADGEEKKDAYNYTGPIDFIQVNDSIFFDLYLSPPLQ